MKNDEAEEDNSDRAFLGEEKADPPAEEPDGERTCSFICARKEAMFHLCDVTYDGQKLRWIAGPHWQMLAVTYIYLSVMSGLVFGLVATYGSYPIVFTSGILVTVPTFIFLTLAAFRDPGIFPKHTRPVARDWTYSNQAGSFRPPKVIFCRECKLLIEDYDHYCPWIGTVVAKNNKLYFSIFVACLTLKLTLDTAVLSYAINQQEKEDEAAAAKCLLFLPLIGLFILLVGMAFRVARGAKTKARFHRPQGGDGDPEEAAGNDQHDERASLRE